MGWPAGFTKQNRINWVEERLQERRAIEHGASGYDMDAAGIPDRISLMVWLARERDGRSWQQVAIKYFPEYKGLRTKTAGISKARRAHLAVENGPDPRKYFKFRMDQIVQDVFGCSPEDFKRYINSIRVSGRKPRC
ncbi:MAG: hypothetical protein ACR2IF_01400 [Terriglobales bacterium]